MKYSELVKARYSCRKFSDKPVEDEKLNAIIEAGIAAPTEKNVQPVKIWLIKSPEALEKIKSCAPFPWMKNIPAVIAVGGTQENAFVRPSDNRNFEDVDASIVATHIMLAITAEGLGSTWVGYFDTVKTKELFPEMKDYDLVALFPIGYPADDATPADRHNIRKPKAEMVTVL
ncbi:MAG: nitroreductase family protein [Synergistaceae bacterium]|nr:nitroreductase family protein [Synergistaceae bacterium]